MTARYLHSIVTFTLHWWWTSTEIDTSLKLTVSRWELVSYCVQRQPCMPFKCVRFFLQHVGALTCSGSLRCSGPNSSQRRSRFLRSALARLHAQTHTHTSGNTLFTPLYYRQRILFVTQARNHHWIWKISSQSEHVIRYTLSGNIWVNKSVHLCPNELEMNVESPVLGLKWRPFYLLLPFCKFHLSSICSRPSLPLSHEIFALVLSFKKCLFECVAFKNHIQL